MSLDFSCRVQAVGKTDPPQDCDWPFCGCDPYATKVLDVLEELDRKSKNDQIMK